MVAVKEGYKQTEVGEIPVDWCLKTLGEVGEVKMCKRIFSFQTRPAGDIPFYKIGTFGKTPDAFIDKALYNEFKRKYSFPTKGQILISASGTIGRTVVYEGEDAYYQDSNIIWLDNDETLISNKFLYYILEIINYNTEGSTIKRLYNSIIKRSKFVCPSSLQEQRAIATALSDVDELISCLDSLIKKKKMIKQGAMQELLTGKTRLDGFGEGVGYKQTEVGTIPEDWEFKELDELLTFGSGQDYKHLSNGDVPVYGTGGLMTYVSSHLYEGDSVGIGRKGTIDKPIYLSGKFWTVDTLFYTHSFLETIPKYIYYKFLLIPWKEYNEASGVPSLNKNTLGKILISLPPTLTEQKAIAEVLSDMDTEINSLETKREKYKQIKQGMMQELLTGKTRLI